MQTNLNFLTQFLSSLFFSVDGIKGWNNEPKRKRCPNMLWLIDHCYSSNFGSLVLYFRSKTKETQTTKCCLTCLCYLWECWHQSWLPPEWCCTGHGQAGRIVQTQTGVQWNQFIEVMQQSSSTKPTHYTGPGWLYGLKSETRPVVWHQSWQAPLQNNIHSWRFLHGSYKIATSHHYTELFLKWMLLYLS